MDMTIAQRLDAIRENIEKAAGGRAVTLVGAAKTKPAELIRAAVAARGGSQRSTSKPSMRA